MAKETKRITQEEMIRKHLNKKGSITSWEAIKLYGCTRLSAKIYNLRNEGLKIRTEHVTKKNRFGYLVTFAKYIKER